MATTTNLSQSKNKDFTWNNASFNWDSVEAKKTWENSYYFSFNLLTREDIFCVEKSSRSINLKKKETVAFLEKQKNLSRIKISERVNVAEGYLDLINYILKIQEAIAVKEVNSKKVTRPLYESFKITEKTWREYLIQTFSRLNFAESYKRNMQILRREGLNISDNLSNHPSKKLFEAVKLLDQNPSWVIDKSVLEAFAVVDCYQDLIGYIVRIQETIAFLEKHPKNASIVKKETLQLAESVFKTVLKAASELLGLTDNVKSINNFKRVFAETLSAAEKITKTIGVTKQELVKITEAYIRNANSVMSDLVFNNKDMTLEEFLEQTSSPIGYEGFKDMQVGEYEYQYALIRLMIEAGVLSVRPQVTEWELNIDIPDTVDRGQAVIPANSHTILFNKHYYKPPEVQVTLKGGSVFNATPSVTAIRTDGFDVVIKDSSGNSISGVISWTSTGY